MSAFADSSALVKLYVPEDGAEYVRSKSTLVVSAIARVEVPAAIWLKHRIGELDAESAATLVAGFAGDYRADPPRFASLDVTAQLLESAAALPGRHGLRAYDSVQLAAALAAAAADSELNEFLCFDARLRAAAAAHGLRPRP